MPPALINAVGGGTNSNGFTTANMATAGATLLVVYVGGLDDWSGAELSDNQSNTWTALTLRSQDRSGTGYNSRLFYVISPATHASAHTVTISANGSYPSGIFAAFSGTTTFDAENGVTGSANDTTRNAGSLTPASSGALLVTGVMSNADISGIAIDNSYTIAATKNYSGGNYFGTSLAYKVHTSGAMNPQWSGSSDFAAAAHAAFTAAASGAAALSVSIGEPIVGLSTF